MRLTPADVDPDWCLLRLHEKNDIIRWQPASPTLVRALLDHHARRGTGHPADQLLRFRDGTPATTRRYDYLWYRLGRHLPRVAAQHISTHWLRHTTLTWIERHQATQAHTHLPPRRPARPRYRPGRFDRRITPTGAPVT